MPNLDFSLVSRAVPGMQSERPADCNQNAMQQTSKAALQYPNQQNNLILWQTVPEPVGAHLTVNSTCSQNRPQDIYAFKGGSSTQHRNTRNCFQLNQTLPSKSVQTTEQQEPTKVSGRSLSKHPMPDLLTVDVFCCSQPLQGRVGYKL